MTPTERAMNIYLNLYKRIGCEAKTKQTGRYMISVVKEANGGSYWDEVLIEFNEL